MPQVRTITKTGFISSLVVLLVGLFPGTIYATGNNRPAGADAGTFSYNETSGMWENQYYTYNPSTGERSPRYDIVYTYNENTGMWDTTTWLYNAPTNSYVSSITSVSSPPAGARTIGGPRPVVQTEPTTTPESPATSTQQTTSSNSSTQAEVNNTNSSLAITGNAAVSSNTNGGSATSGNAQAITNLINLLQSSTNSLGTSGQFVTFSSDINGDVNGDILLDPATLATIQPANNANVVIRASNDVDALINNSLTIGAASGDATVMQNTNAGNATTGTADAVANVINVVNSAISSGQSFLGVMNINGNLNGDILLPDGFVDRLLENNVPSTVIDTSNLDTNRLTIESDVTQAIHNDIDLSAASGTASVSGNTNAGNAQTGNASTNLTVFNLTGSNTVGANNLLVFVNVLGTWVGLIVNAPEGATSASLGGGITQHEVNAAVDQAVNQQIRNDINVAAQSGDATVSGNTNAGSARTGNATASANILNILGSQIALSDWFGILFINVFGNWRGSFGVNTDAGSAPLMHNPIVAGAATSPENTKAFRFVPTGVKDKYKLSSYGAFNTSVTPEAQQESPKSSETTQTAPEEFIWVTSGNNAQQPLQRDWLLPVFGSLVGASMLGGERIVSRRKK